MKIHSPNMTHDEWVISRLGKITGSDVYRIVGDPKTIKDREAGKISATAMTYAMEKAAEILSGSAKSFTSSGVEWGDYQEQYAFDAWAEKTGMGFEAEYHGNQNPTFLEYGEHAGISPDFLHPELYGEIKCPECSENHVWYSLIKCAADLKEIEPKYYWQVQKGLLVSGLPMAHFCSFDPRMPDGYKLHIAEILPVAEDQEILRVKIARTALEIQRIVQDFKAAFGPIPEIPQQETLFQ